MKHIITTVALLLIAASVFAQQQTFSGYVEVADTAFGREDYYNAYRLYEIASQFTGAEEYSENIGEVRYKAGVAAYRATAYGVAKEQLLGLQQLPSGGKEFPLLKYYLAQSNFRQGEYDKAAVLFQEFLDEEPDADPAFLSAAQAQINDADWAIDAMSRAEDISLKHLPEGINSPDSDIEYTRGPAQTTYFTSNRFEHKRDTLFPKRMLSRIMRQTGTTTAEPLDQTINLPNKNVAHTAFNREQNYVYYSVCDFRKNKRDNLICDLYRAEINDEGSWVNPRPLDVNMTGYSTTQPSVGLDATDGREYLFFASDRPGGKGGHDLYRASIAEDGTVGVPENLSYLNTPGEDATPFWYAPRQTLYFSTDGRFTFGGLDIYRAYRIDGTFRRPINLGAPVNSSADEAYYTRFDDADVAYVSSRRPGEEALFYTGEREVCCYEIYEFTPDPRIDLQALTFNELTGERLNGATVALYEIQDGEPVLIEEITQPDTNLFNFMVMPGGQYELRANKEGNWTTDIDVFDLSDPEFEGVPLIERELFLAQRVKLDVFTFKNIDSTDLEGATVILYEVAEDGTRIPVDTITNPVGNDFSFDVEVGKNYVVVGSRPGYGDTEESVDLRDYDPDDGDITRNLYFGQSLIVYVIDGWTDEALDSATIRQLGRGGEEIDRVTNLTSNDFYYTVDLNRPLVLNTSRAGYYPRTDTLLFTEQDLIDNEGELVYYVPLFTNDPERILPFDVYFDNDYPNPRTVQTTTDSTYEETYYPYVERERVFRQEFTSKMDTQQAFLVRGEMEQFFNDQVRTGWERLQRFAEALVFHARNGGTFTVSLRGFASPRAKTWYNERLSARRNDSVKNFFREFNNGVLLPYLENGQIDFVEAALGESTADTKKISDRLDRPEESIYSVVASLERRVELSKALVQKKK